MELSTHIEIACRLYYLAEVDVIVVRELVDNVSRILLRLAIMLGA
jgi:hypothetical protein